MFNYFNEQKEKIKSWLSDHFEKDRQTAGRINHFSADVREKLYQFAIRGKMIRGGLVRLGYELYTGAQNDAVIACGAAMELLQSALLIHDDIMDRDETRRGERTVHHQYFLQAQKQGLEDAQHIGEALGICVGDISFFLAFQILSCLPVPPAVTQKLIFLVSCELGLVGTAQMLDVSWGAADPSAQTLTDEIILDLYRHKTGRYSFSLPLSVGALLAGRDEAQVIPLERLGEQLGIIFQIKDDELGLFGDEKDTGKPVGSDIREGKKTIFFEALARELSEGEKKGFLAVFGNPDISQKDVEYVRDLVRAHGIVEKIQAMIDTLAQECRKDIEALPVANREKKHLLTELLDYSLERKN